MPLREAGMRQGDRINEVHDGKGSQGRSNVGVIEGRQGASQQELKNEHSDADEPVDPMHRLGDLVELAFLGGH